MSDGITDAYRMQEEAQAYNEFVSNLADYMQKPTPKLRKNLEGLSHRIDYFKTSEYWKRPVSTEKLFWRMIKKLKSGDESEWVKLLKGLNESSEEYEKLKKASPLKDDFLIEVDFGMGFVRLSVHGLEGKITDKLKSEGNKTYNCQKYFLKLPEKSMDDLLKNAGVISVK